MYLDIIMLLNFMVDYLLLLGTNQLTGYQSEQKRVLLAALTGAMYSGGCMTESMRFLMSLHWRIIFLIVILLMAFGFRKDTIKRGMVFLFLSISLGGMSLLFYKGSHNYLILVTVLFYGAIRFASGYLMSFPEFIPIEIIYGKSCYKFTALRDTGNLLRDPVSGESVLIVEDYLAKKITGLSSEELRMPLDTISKKSISGLRLIPYKTVGQNCGMLLAMRFYNVKVAGVKRSMIIAFSPNELGGQTYQAIAGGAAL